MINFTKFTEEKEDFIKGVQSQSLAVLEERDQLVLQNSELEAKIAQIQCVY